MNRLVNKDPFYVILNFVTGAVSGIPTFRNLSYLLTRESKRFLALGFYFDPFNEIKI